MESPYPQNVKCRARKPNFTNDEIDCLLELVTQNRDILLSNDYKSHTMRQKQIVWTQIADDVTLNGDRLCQRDASDVRQKWKDLLVSTFLVCQFPVDQIQGRIYIARGRGDG